MFQQLVIRHEIQHISRLSGKLHRSELLCHQRRPQLQSVYGNTYEVRKPLAIGFKKRNTVEVPLQWRAFPVNSSGRVLFQALPDLAAGAVATEALALDSVHQPGSRLPCQDIHISERLAAANPARPPIPGG